MSALGDVVMQTPWNMPTATATAGRTNHWAEERLHRTVSELETKQRKAAVNMNRKILEIMEELERIQQTSDTQLDLEKPEPESRCRSSGDPKEKRQHDKDKGGKSKSAPPSVTGPPGPSLKRKGKTKKIQQKLQVLATKQEETVERDIDSDVIAMVQQANDITESEHYSPKKKDLGVFEDLTHPPRPSAYKYGLERKLVYNEAII